MRIALRVVLTLVSCAAAPRAMAQVFQPPQAVTAETPPVDVYVNTLFNTNVADSSAALAATRGLTRGDWSVTPDVALNLSHTFGPESLFLKGDVGYNFYDHNKLLDREKVDLQGGATAQVGRCDGEAFAAIDRHQSYLQDIAVAGPLVRNTQELDSVGFQGACGGQIGFGPEVSVTQSWEGNSTPQFQVFNYRQTTVTGALVYQRPNFGKLSAFGQYDEATYPNQPISLGGPLGNHYNLYAGGLRFERDIGARIALAASAAYVWLKPLAAPSFTSVNYRVDLTYRITGRTSALVSADRDARPALLNDAAYLVDETYKAEIDYALSKRLNLALGGSEERRRYGGPTLGLTPALSNENLRDAYLTAHMDFGRRFYLAADARYEVRHADDVQLNYNSAQVGVTLGAHF